MYIAKYDPNGNILWAKSFGSSGLSSESGNGLSIDKDGNVYVTGNFEGWTC